MGVFNENLTKKNRPTRKVSRWEHKREPVIITLTDEDVNRSPLSRNISFDRVGVGDSISFPLTDEQEQALRKRSFDGFIFEHPDGAILFKDSAYGYQPIRRVADHRLDTHNPLKTPAHWCLVGVVKEIRRFANDKDPDTDEVELDLD